MKDGQHRTYAEPGKKVTVTKKADDPEGIVRVSVGDSGNRVYCVYRGTRQQAYEALRYAATALRRMDQDGAPEEVAPDDGKEYA